MLEARSYCTKYILIYKKNELFLHENAVLDLRVENKIFVEKR